MAPTRKMRQGPLKSATLFTIGTKKRGEDGNMWIITSTKNGTHRWVKFSKNNNSTLKIKRNKMPQNAPILDNGQISLSKLKQLKKKYQVSGSGSKKNMAQVLWGVRRSALENQDLHDILPLLEIADQKDVKKILENRNDHPITNYKGMWEPISKSILSMSRDELINKLRKFRNAWEKITTRDQDLSDERLKSETTDALRILIKFYYSNNGKLLAEDWLRKSK